MDIQDRRALKRAAAEACSGTSCDPKKLVLIHTGAMVAVTLILLVVGYIVDEQIGSTGGLSGMGNRAILTTVQLVLQLGQFVATPFWQIGWLYVTLQIARREQVQPGDLLEGFRQFFPVLRLLFLKGFMYLGIAILCTNIASIVFAMTPWADPIMEVTMGGMDAMDPTKNATLVLNITNPIVSGILKQTEEKQKMIVNQVYYLAMIAYKKLSPEELSEFIEKSSELLFDYCK